jgi:23S rRNA (cytidine1920-2'-O)/16S rRNA (cytidine1409-2'-O)-methyltransferase
MVHRDVLVDVLSSAEALGYLIKGLERSPILGPKGNTEFFVWLQAKGDASNLDGKTQDHIKRVINGAI